MKSLDAVWGDVISGNGEKMDPGLESGFIVGVAEWLRHSGWENIDSRNQPEMNRRALPSRSGAATPLLLIFKKNDYSAPQDTLKRLPELPPRPVLLREGARYLV